LGPVRYRQPRLATVHVEPGPAKHGRRRFQRLVRRQLYLWRRRGRLRPHHSHALPGNQRRQPRRLAGGIDWTDQLANWAQTIETAFAQYHTAHGTNYQFVPNLDARVTSWEPNWYDNASGVPFIDGAFLKGFGQYTDTYNWTLSMNRGLNLTGNGKIVIMQPYPSADPSTAAGQQQVNFLLGTYLLLKGTYLNIDYGGGVQYYPQYELNPGTAVTPLPSDVSGYLWNGLYRRDFQKASCW
jgi:hypothetical protein